MNSRKEGFSETESKERFLTAPEVVYRLLEKHPEIIQISLAAYSPHPHGTNPGDLYNQFIPVSEELSNLAESQWRRTFLHLDPEIVAIGSAVTICSSADCDHSLQSHFAKQLWLWSLWHEGENGPKGLQRSFIFLDIETNRPEIVDKLGEMLEGVSSDWYIINSGEGFHVILDRLVALEDLATEYGRILTFFGERMGSQGLKAWGEDLQRDGNKAERVFLWCDRVLRFCGHVDEPLSEERKEVHLIDLRHVAHSLQMIEGYRHWLAQNSTVTNFGPGYDFPDEIGGAYLRISPKKRGGLPPVLVAQREGLVTQYFSSAANYFGLPNQLEMF